MNAPVKKDALLAFFETFAAVEEDLQISAYEIQRMLKELFTSQGDTRIDVATVIEKRAALSERILVKMGTTLGAVLRNHMFPDRSFRDFCFYFWPGYNRITDSGRETLSFVTDPDGSVKCGHGEDHRRDKQDSRSEQSALWYHRALTVHRDDEHDDKKPFVPGGTHLWAASYNGQYQQRGASRVELSNDLPFLEVIVGSDDDVTTEVPEAYRAFIVQLEGCNWDGWPEQLSSHLNALGKFADVKWPFTQEQIDDAHDPLPIADRVRLELYRVWLAVTFGPIDERRFRALLASVDAKLKAWENSGVLSRYNMTALRNRLRVARGDENIAWRTYKYWYTIPTVAILGDAGATLEPLGSAMLLTTHRIPPPFLRSIRTWVDGIYGQLRRFEQLLAIEQKTRISQDKANRQVFAHSVQGYINPIKGALGRVGAEFLEKARAEAAVRQLQFAVNLFSHRSFTQIPSELRENRPLQWEQCVQDALRLAVVRLLDRCGIGNNKSFDRALDDLDNGKEINEAVRRLITKNRIGRDGWELNPNTLLERIGPQVALTCPQGLISNWNDDAEEGLYTYVLTQAMFHAAVFSCLAEVLPRYQPGSLSQVNCCPPYLRLNFSEDLHSLVVENRSIASDFDFSHTRDFETLREIASKFNKSVEGWVTIHPGKVRKSGDWFRITLQFQQRTLIRP